MKNLIAILFTLVGFSAFAGPEDIYEDQICFGLEAKDLKAVVAQAPTELCFESLHLDTYNKDLVFYTAFSQHRPFFRDLRVTNLVQSGPDSYSFNAQNAFLDEYDSACSDGVRLTLLIKGEVDFMGYGDPRLQTLTLMQEKTNDVCHIEPDIQQFNYVRTR